MTDFIDGTENPKGEARADVALVKEAHLLEAVMLWLSALNITLPLGVD